MKKTISVLLSLCILFAFPVTVHATEPPTLEAEYAWHSVSLRWSWEEWFDGMQLEKSVNGTDWSYVGDYGEAPELDLVPKTVMYYRVRPYYEEYDAETGEYVIKYGGYSAPVRVLPEIEDILSNGVIDITASSKKVKLTWYTAIDDKAYIDGFKIYKSTNGGAMTYTGTVSASKGKEYDYQLNYSFSEAAPNAYAYTARYSIVPYYTIGGKTYEYKVYEYGEEVAGDCCYIGDNFAKVKTKKNSVVITAKKSAGTKYKIEYTKYKIKNGKKVKSKTVKTSKTKYTIKNANTKNYRYVISVYPYWGKITPEYGAYLDSHDSMTLMKSAAKVKKKSIPVINTRTKKSKTHWTYSLSKKDKKTLKKFFKKYTDKHPKATRADKALYALQWINRKVDYDYSMKKSANRTYVDAIFNKKAGQCLQYNGAYAAVLNYLGYESRVIEGYRFDRKGKPTVNHYWCEVKINGRWYLCETGNYGKNGEWMYFCSLYHNGLGYAKNGKAAKD